MAVTCWCARCDGLVEIAQPIDGKPGDPDHIIATCHGQHDRPPFNDYSGTIRFFEIGKKGRVNQ